MDTNSRQPETRRDQLSDTLRQMTQSLRHLEDLGTSLLAAVRELSSPSNAKFAKAPSPESMQELQEVQPCDVKDTNDGGFESPLLKEDLISFVEAAQLIPSSTPPHAATISRWCSSGVRGVKLESIRIASRRATSKQAVARFLEACRQQDFAGLAGATAVELGRALAARDAVDSAGQDGTKSSPRSQIARPGKGVAVAEHEKRPLRSATVSEPWSFDERS